MDDLDGRYLLKEELIKLKAQKRQQLIDYINELSQAYINMESFGFTMAHELKSPIREIELYAKFIEEDEAVFLPEQSLKDIQSIRRVCSNMKSLIQNFMEYSNAGYRILSWENVPMKKTIYDSFTNIINSFPDRNINLEIAELPDIKGDIFLIQQMVINILSNSIKFTQSSEKAAIRVYSKTDTDMVNYYFEDNGVGFDMKYASNIFRVFERIHNDQEYEGYGVGLATVKKIVERFNGKVEILGQPYKGCTVTLKFPIEMMSNEYTTSTDYNKKRSIIKIGILCDISGEFAYMETCRRAAYEFARDEINNNGGINGKPIQLIFKDSKSDIIYAANQAWNLVQTEQVDVIMGGLLSTTRESIRKVADDTKTLYFYDVVYEGGVADHYTFCTGMTPDHKLQPLLEYLIPKHGKKCYIITADFNYGILTAEWLKGHVDKLGGEVVAVEYFQATKRNFDVTIENILEIKPDIVFSFCVAPENNLFFKQWSEKGDPAIKVVSTLGLNVSYLHKTFPVPAMKNTYFISSYMEELDTPAAKAFRDSIRSRYSEQEVPYIGGEAENVYTTMYLYKRAVEMAETTQTEEVIRALETGKVWVDGPGGRVIVRGEDHHVIRDVSIFTVDEKHKIHEIAKYQGIYSTYIEKVIEKETGIKGGLKKLGTNSPNVQYNLMFHRV